MSVDKDDQTHNKKETITESKKKPETKPSVKPQATKITASSRVKKCSEYAKANVKDWSEEIEIIEHQLLQEYSQHDSHSSDEVCDTHEQEDWMQISKLVHTDNSNLKQNSQVWSQDYTNYTQQQIGEMPNWIPQHSSLALQQWNAAVDISLFTSMQKIAYEVIKTHSLQSVGENHESLKMIINGEAGTVPDRFKCNPRCLFFTWKKRLFEEAALKKSPVKLKKFIEDKKAESTDILMNDKVVIEELTESDIDFQHRQLVLKELNIGKLTEIALQQIITLKAKAFNVQKPVHIQTQRGTS
eukprot:gene4003-4552_t